MSAPKQRKTAHEQRVFYYALLGGLPAIISTIWMLIKKLEVLTVIKN